ncbi:MULTISPECIES: hypothetical protein [Pyrobaculum]|nr:hypothetical protein [Pyrobaculum arsenaticum]MCY0889668.1 hypothetical protein [Pyrobaculum arsenaticum]
MRGLDSGGCDCRGFSQRRSLLAMFTEAAEKALEEVRRTSWIFFKMS